MLNTRLYSSLKNDLKKANTKSLKFHIHYTPQQKDQPEPTSDDSSTVPALDSETQDSPKQQNETRSYSDEEVKKAIGLFMGVDESSDPSELIVAKSHKFDTLAQTLTGKANATLLPFKDIKLKSPTPYHMKCIDENNSDSRLSVTKMIPSIWCELKTIYRLYQGQVEEPNNESMTRGKAEHLNFELETHPVDQLAVQDTAGESVVFELDHLRTLEPEASAHETQSVSSPMISLTESIQSSGPLQYTQRSNHITTYYHITF
ncbi:unnamed protein product [Ambrosiozyma monospora]|uniref:Unnamed protein product n=1 Tax=Ambrosiozyma monospora TaxID=43982 RepID=A0ACB5TKQ5_AMBMO|nr:unnamed protein product [Ambrosiozyma monospora]